MNVERLVWGCGMLTALLMGLFVGRSWTPASVDGALKTTSVDFQSTQVVTPPRNTYSVTPVREKIADSRVTLEIAGDDPISALARADELPSEFARRKQYHEIFELWAEIDPDAALAYIDAHPLSGAKYYDGRLTGLVSGLAATNPARALEIAVERNDGMTERFRVYDALFLSAAESNQLGKASAALANLPQDLEDYRAAYRSSGWAWGQTNPRMAADWIAGLDERSAKAARGGLLLVWPVLDPEGASTYMIENGESATQIGKVFSRWAKTDIEAASTWLLQHEPTEKLDGAVYNLANEAIKVDPEGALGWAESIVSETKRERMLNRIRSSMEQPQP